MLETEIMRPMVALDFVELVAKSDPLEALAISTSRQPNEYASSDFGQLGYKASPEAFGSMSDYEQRTL